MNPNAELYQNAELQLQISKFLAQYLRRPVGGPIWNEVAAAGREFRHVGPDGKETRVRIDIYHEESP